MYYCYFLKNIEVKKYNFHLLLVSNNFYLKNKNDKIFSALQKIYAKYKKIAKSSDFL